MDKPKILAGLGRCSQCGLVVVCLECGNKCCTGNINECCITAYKIQQELDSQYLNGYSLEDYEQPICFPCKATSPNCCEPNGD